MFSLLDKFIVPKWLIAGIDALVLFQGIFLGYLFLMDLNGAEYENTSFLPGIFIYVSTGLLVMLFTKSYQGIVRHTSWFDAIVVIKTVAIHLSLLLLLSFVAAWLDIDSYLPPASALIFSSVFSLFILIFYRLLVKHLYQLFKTDKEDIKAHATVIFGAGEGGVQALDAVKKNKHSRMDVVAFLDDDPQKDGKSIQGKAIYKGLEKLDFLVENYSVSNLIISCRDISIERKNEIMDACIRLNISVLKVLPSELWINREDQIDTLQEIKIEDLLSRDEIVLDNSNISLNLVDKVVLVSGAAGSIGSELSRQILHYKPKELIILDISESALFDMQQELMEHPNAGSLSVVLADIRDRKKLNGIFKNYKPEIVFHAAAYKHVPMMEHFPEESIRTNVLGTKNVADLSVLFKVSKFVLVSTDKAVNPTNVMGATKRAAEMYVQSLNEYLVVNHKKSHTKFITTRFGNVLGSNGSVVPVFKRQLASGGPLKVTHPEITRYFMTIPEACQLVLEAGVMGKGGEVYVFDMGKAIKIVDLAKRMIELSGKKVDQDIKIKFTGLREGEKLYEELLNDHEMVNLSPHPKIKIAKVQAAPYLRVNNQVEMFYDLLETSTDFDLVRNLKILVPEYISQSSKFETLDRVN